MRLKRGLSLLLVGCIIAVMVPCAAATNLKRRTTVIAEEQISAAILENGDLYMWGRNDMGHLGTGGKVNAIADYPKAEIAVQTVPCKVMGSVASVALNSFTNAAITTNGDLYVWGSNHVGQIGNGGAGDRLQVDDYGEKYFCQTAPVKVMSNVVDVRVYGGVCAAITENGDLYVWGGGFWAQTGNGTLDNQPTPLKILSNVIDVQFTPFSAAALTKNGNLYLWGAVSFGNTGVGIPSGAETAVVQQGDGNRTEVILRPVKILSNISSFDLNTYSIAAIARNGNFYLWGGHGKNFQGEPKCIMNDVKSFVANDLFSYMVIDKSGDVYKCEVSEEPKLFWQGEAKAVAGTKILTTQGDLRDGNKKLLGDVVDFTNNAALTEDGELYLISDKNKLTKVLSDVVWLEGERALTANGDLYAWGENCWGNLGDGTTEDKDAPVKVLSGVDLPEDALDLEPENQPTLAPTATLEPKPTQPSTPVAVDTTTFAINGYNAAAISKSGDLYVWGRADQGAVGNGGLFDTASILGLTGLTAYTTPVNVLSNVASVSLSEGPGTTAAITTNGDLYMWGTNYVGQLGNGGGGDQQWSNMDGVQYNQTTPVKVLENVVSVTNRSNSTMAITGNGDLYAWGSAAGQEFGGPEQTTPVKLLSNVASVELLEGTSTLSACWAAIATNGDLYIWGDITGLAIDHLLPADAATSDYINGDGVAFTMITTPVKIMENISSVDLACNYFGVITTENVFYEFTAEGKRNRVAENVAKLCLGSPDRYLTLDGDLYERGDFQWKKVLGDVVDIWQGAAALTKSGDVYYWPFADSGSTPDKVLDDVVAIGTDNDYNIIALTENGELYIWGFDNSYGLTGNGSTVKQETPCLVMENVALPGEIPITTIPSGVERLDPSAWYYTSMVFAYAKGMETGIPGELFAPKETLTRSMLAQMLYNLDGRPAVTGNNFIDVADSAWYAQGVNWAAEYSIVLGDGNGRAKPEDPITREQMALLLYRYAAHKGYDVTAKADLSVFPDASELSSYAVEAMQWANAEGLITGITAASGKLLSPRGTASCAEMATILMRFVESNS